MAASGRSGADAVLIAALAAGATYEAAAEQAGVSERTVRRRLEDEAFRNELAEARADMIAQTTAQLTAASTEAVATLRALLSSDLDFVKLAAARAILSIGETYRTTHTVLQRLEDVERKLGARGKGR